MKEGIFESIDVVEINNYLKTRVLPILEPLQMQILNQRPQNVSQFAYQWLQRFKETEQNKNQIEESDDQQPEEVFRQKIRQKRLRQKQGRKAFRIGVSGQPTTITFTKNNQANNEGQLQERQEAKVRILVELRKSILFKNVTHSSLMDLIQKMRVKQYQRGDVVIRERDQGDEMFLIDEGQFKCVKSQRKAEQRILGPGQVFGQVALLYNSRSPCTIVAQTEGRLWSLGRMDYYRILREKVLKKREMFEGILSKVEIFQTFDRYQKSKVFEALQEIQIPGGKYIIREGQLGDRFYIVAEGKLVAQKVDDNEIKPVYYYKEGDYFGQLAIIKNVLRQASVKALTKSKLLFLQRSAFKRLLGSIEYILKKNESRYKNSPVISKNRKHSYDHPKSKYQN